MKIDKKGFTLIELLAVIVILAIIALIAVPIILNVINDARKGAAKDSAYGFIEAIEFGNVMAENSEENSKYELIEDGTYTNVNEINPKVHSKGEKPTLINKLVISKLKVVEAELCIGGYSVKYENNVAIVGSRCEGTYTEPETSGPSNASEVGYENEEHPNVHSVEDALNDLYGE